MKRLRSRICLLVGVLFVCAGPSYIRAQEEPRGAVADLRAELLSLRWKILDLEARKKVWEQAQEQLRKNNEPDARAAPQSADLWLPLLEEAMQGAQETRLERIDDLNAKLTERMRHAEKLWRDAQDAGLKLVDEELAAETTWGSLDPDSKDASYVDLGTLAIVGWGLLLLSLSFLLGMHSLRRDIRRRARFKGKLAVAALLGFVLLGNLGSRSRADGKGTDHPDVKDLRTQILQANADHNQLHNRLAALQAQVRAQRKAALQAWAAPFPGDDKKGFQRTIVRDEEAAFEKLHDLFVLADTIEQASAQALDLVDETAEKRADLEARIAQEQERVRGKVLIKIGLCLGFMMLAFLPLRVMERSSRRAQEAQARQCPCCLRAGSLKLKARNEDPRYPELHYLECEGTDGDEGCGYEFRASYLKLPRLCFPSVGIRGSGKTHWLVTAYDMIRNHRVALPAAIQTAPALADEEFDHQIDLILENHNTARATAHSTSIPHPLIFHVRDADQLGPSQAMLNLFDFAGEMMIQRIDTDRLRQRALLMDGFVLFLDPTQVVRKKGNVSLSLKEQVQALAAFHEEMRDMRGLDVGAPLNVPIAVCLSKLDLVVTHNPFSGAARPWIQALRDSFAKPLSLAALHQRSVLCEQAIGVMFPGWNLRRTLNENFGPRVLFFPMTPVGIEEAELGVTDLSKRTFAPVGILEPILWLLHMHGYRLFH